MSEWEKAMELEDTQLMAEKMDSVLLAVSEAVCKGDYTMDKPMGVYRPSGDVWKAERQADGDSQPGDGRM